MAKPIRPINNADILAIVTGLESVLKNSAENDIDPKHRAKATELLAELHIRFAELKASGELAKAAKAVGQMVQPRIELNKSGIDKSPNIKPSDVKKLGR
jgi:hypothetical protein